MPTPSHCSADVPGHRPTAAVAALAAGCGSSTSGSSSGGTLTLYSAQHEQMTNALAKAFERKTGATVRVRFGEDEGLANQIVQEGSASPADALLTENTPPLELLSKKGCSHQSSNRRSRKCRRAMARPVAIGSALPRVRRC